LFGSICSYAIILTFLAEKDELGYEATIISRKMPNQPIVNVIDKLHPVQNINGPDQKHPRFGTRLIENKSSPKTTLDDMSRQAATPAATLSAV